MRHAAGWQLVPPRNKTESGEECNPKHPPLSAAQKSPSSWLYVIGTNFDGKLKRLLSPFFSAGEEWVDHAPSARAGRMRWPHISAATKRARYSGALVRACVRNGKAIFLCVVLRFQLGLFSSVTFFVRVFPTMRSLHSAGKFVATEINTLLNASESLLIFSLSLPHSLSHSHLSSPSDLLTCADKLCG